MFESSTTSNDIEIFTGTGVRVINIKHLSFQEVGFEVCDSELTVTYKFKLLGCDEETYTVTRNLSDTIIENKDKFTERLKLAIYLGESCYYLRYIGNYNVYGISMELHLDMPDILVKDSLQLIEADLLTDCLQNMGIKPKRVNAEVNVF